MAVRPNIVGMSLSALKRYLDSLVKLRNARHIAILQRSFRLAHGCNGREALILEALFLACVFKGSEAIAEWGHKQTEKHWFVINHFAWSCREEQTFVLTDSSDWKGGGYFDELAIEFKGVISGDACRYLDYLMEGRAFFVEDDVDEGQKDADEQMSDEQMVGELHDQQHADGDGDEEGCGDVEKSLIDCHEGEVAGGISECQSGGDCEMEVESEIANGIENAEPEIASFKNGGEGSSEDDEDGSIPSEDDGVGMFLMCSYLYHEEAKHLYEELERVDLEETAFSEWYHTDLVTGLKSWLKDITDEGLDLFISTS